MLSFERLIGFGSSRRHHLKHNERQTENNLNLIRRKVIDTRQTNVNARTRPDYFISFAFRCQLSPTADSRQSENRNRCSIVPNSYFRKSNFSTFFMCDNLVLALLLLFLVYFFSVFHWLALLLAVTARHRIARYFT